MSFSRFGCEGSDIYAFPTGIGYECYGPHAGESWYRTKDAEAFLHHLHEHRIAGDCVPDCAFEAFRDYLTETHP